MFVVLKLGNWQGVGGSSFYQLAERGLEAVRERERLGLPPSSDSGVRVALEGEPAIDRRAAESWPEALDSDADLPLAVLSNRADCEVHALVGAGLLAFAGPKKFVDDSGKEVVGLSLRLTCSPFELVCWRRAWRADLNRREAEARVDQLEKQIEEMEALAP